MTTATATLVFTDLVGSTALLSRVGEQQSEELRREHFSLLREAIADAGGREVKNLGDGLMVAFDGVGAALACSVSMQQAMAGRPVGSEPLEIRIGISVGEADLDDGDYFGLPVVEAARLCAEAGTGEILVTEFVRMLARSRGGFDLDHVGALDLKGLPEPVDAYRVRWEPRSRVGDAQVPLQRRVAALAVPMFVGRAVEQDRLGQAMKAVGAGDRRAVLLSGEPGIGKTTLAASFAVGAMQQGASVLYGRCDEDLFAPYQPWIEALGHLVEHADEAAIAEHVAVCGVVLGRIVPEVWRRSPSHVIDEAPDEGEASRHLLFNAVSDLLARTSEHAPLVLLLDDLHWADEGSVQLLRHVLSASRSMRVLVIGTFRDSDIGSTHVLADVLARLHREHGVERLHVQGLGDVELLAYLERLAGHELGEPGVALRDVLLAETDGNPFFVGEIVRHLRETGAIYQDEQGTWLANFDIRTTGLPVSIREVVGRRMAALGPETLRVLTLASVIGRDFDLPLLVRVADVDEDALIDLCDLAVEAAVLREGESPDSYCFTHALIEYSLYDEQSTHRRARAHRAVAEAIESLYGETDQGQIAQLAYHWAQASRPQDAERAIRYARLAGDQAIERLAPAEAQRWYRDALALSDDADARSRAVLELRVRLGEADRLAGVESYRDALVDAAADAIAAEEPALLVRAVLAGDRGYNGNTGMVDEPFVGVVRAALDAVGPSDSADRARLMGLLAVELTWAPGSPDERLELVSQALAMARRLDDERTFAQVVSNGDEPRCVPDRASANVRDTTEACAIAERVGSLGLRIRARTTAASALLDVGDRDGFDRVLAVLETEAAEMGLPDFDVCATFHRIHAAQLDGDAAAVTVEGNRYFESSMAAGAPANASLVRSSALVMAGAMRGDLDAVPEVEQAIADNPLFPPLRALLAWSLVVGGRPADAAETMRQDRANEFVLPYNEGWISQAFWLEAASSIGDVESVAVLLPRLEEWSELIAYVQGFCGCSIAHYAGVGRQALGDLDLAVDHLEHAATVHERLRAPFHRSWSQVALSRALAERAGAGDGERARMLASDASAVAGERRYPLVDRAARAVLDQLP